MKLIKSSPVDYTFLKAELACANFITRTTPNTNQWTSVCHGATGSGGSLFVAVAQTGTGNRAMSSPDGITWTARTTPADNSWQAVCMAGINYIAVASSGTQPVMTSSNGTTWTIRTAPNNVPWYGVCYNGSNRAVAVGDHSTSPVMYSNDYGSTWTQVTAPGGIYTAVCFANKQFVAVGTGVVMTSPDGITWTARTCPAHSWRSVTYGNGLYVAVATSGPDGNRIMTSPDGITWTIRSTSLTSGAQFQDVKFFNGLFVAVIASGITGFRFRTSPDGITWTRRGVDDHSWYGIAYGDSCYAAVSLGGQAMSSTMRL